jgi:hypothetical protein
VCCAVRFTCDTRLPIIIIVAGRQFYSPWDNAITVLRGAG